MTLLTYIVTRFFFGEMIMQKTLGSGLRGAILLALANCIGPRIVIIPEMERDNPFLDLHRRYMSDNRINRITVGCRGARMMRKHSTMRRTATLHKGIRRQKSKTHHRH